MELAGRARGHGLAFTSTTRDGDWCVARHRQDLAAELGGGVGHLRLGRHEQGSHLSLALLVQGPAQRICGCFKYREAIVDEILMHLVP